MKKTISLFLLALMLCAGSAFAADAWDEDSYGDEAPAKTEDKGAVARNLAALAKKPEALRAAANIAKIRMKQREEAAAAAAAGR